MDIPSKFILWITICYPITFCGLYKNGVCVSILHLSKSSLNVKNNIITGQNNELRNPFRSFCNMTWKETKNPSFCVFIITFDDYSFACFSWRRRSKDACKRMLVYWTSANFWQCIFYWRWDWIWKEVGGSDVDGAFANKNYN
jgi:hypothetical protein